jgi:hypothetical protein
VCTQQDEVRYSGRFDSLTLERCGQVRIDHAQIGRLVLNASTVSISDSVISNSGGSGEGVALTARDSEITATAVQISGRVAIRTDNSYFDLAGVSLRAREQGLEMVGERSSRVFFSVSDWQGSDYWGDAHFVWPRAGGGR